MHARRRPPARGRAGGREDALAELIAYHFREAATLTNVSETAQLDAVEIRRKAVGWLNRAADVAAAGARPPRPPGTGAAIELAATTISELQERLGDVSGGRRGAEAYGWRFGSAGSTAGRSTRSCASWAACSPGTCAPGDGREQADGGDRGSARTAGRLGGRDERAIASFLIADGFYPFWRGAQATPADTPKPRRARDAAW